MVYTQRMWADFENVRRLQNLRSIKRNGEICKKIWSSKISCKIAMPVAFWPKIFCSGSLEYVDMEIYIRFAMMASYGKWTAKCESFSKRSRLFNKKSSGLENLTPNRADKTEQNCRLRFSRSLFKIKQKINFEKQIVFRLIFGEQHRCRAAERRLYDSVRLL